MASQGATLQNYNNVPLWSSDRLLRAFQELVKSIEDLREKREELNRQILKDRMMGRAHKKRRSQASIGVLWFPNWLPLYI